MCRFAGCAFLRVDAEEDEMTTTSETWIVTSGGPAPVPDLTLPEFLLAAGTARPACARRRPDPGVA